MESGSGNGKSEVGVESGNGNGEVGVGNEFKNLTRSSPAVIDERVIADIFNQTMIFLRTT